MSSPFSKFKLPASSQFTHKAGEGGPPPSSSSRPVSVPCSGHLPVPGGAAGGSRVHPCRVPSSPTGDSPDLRAEGGTQALERVRVASVERDSRVVVHAAGGDAAPRPITAVVFGRRAAPRKNDDDGSDTSDILEFGPAGLRSPHAGAPNWDEYAADRVTEDGSPRPEDDLGATSPNPAPDTAASLPNNSQHQTQNRRPKFCLSQLNRGPNLPSSPLAAAALSSPPSTWLRSVVLPSSSPAVAASSPHYLHTLRCGRGGGSPSDLLRNTLGQRRSEEVLWRYRCLGSIGGNAIKPDMSVEVLRAKRTLGMIIAECVVALRARRLPTSVTSAERGSPLTVCLCSYALDGPGAAADVSVLESLDNDFGGGSVPLVDLFEPFASLGTRADVLICSRWRLHPP